MHFEGGTQIQLFIKLKPQMGINQPIFTKYIQSMVFLELLIKQNSVNVYNGIANDLCLFRLR